MNQWNEIRYNNPRILTSKLTMGNKVVKDPNFPMQHAQITELENTGKIAEIAKKSDILITSNGETVAYLVNSEHYEALISNWIETRATASETFLQNYQQRHGNLNRLDEAIAASKRRERATPEEEAAVFGDKMQCASI